MEYFLGKEEFSKINESNFNEIKCISRYNITEEDFSNFSSAKITVENNTIICRNEDFFTKFSYLGSLPSTSTSYTTYETSLEERVIFNVVKHQYTLLYVRDKSKTNNILFDNGMKYLRINFVCNKITEIEFYNSYLVIVTRNIEKSKNKRRRLEGPPALGFILIKFIPKSDNEDMLVEVFKTNLYDLPSLNLLSNLYIVTIIFNLSKILLMLENDANVFLMTFNIKTLKFSSLLKFNKCKGVNNLHPRVFYCYSNILQDVIIYVDVVRGIVYIVKESTENGLYIFNKTCLPISGGNILRKICCCSNRNNEIFLLINSFIENEFGNMESDIPFYYDVLNSRTCKLFHQFNKPLGIDAEVFFNPTGEEIFVVDENQLEIYVYKSKVRSLKRACQILVWEQYSSEQLNLMNLPKYLLHND